MSNSLAAAQRIDFDHWLKLAKTNPDDFEQLRSQTVAACIANSSSAHQERLHKLQWRVDRIRDISSNPMAACIKISGLMWSTFHQLGDIYNHLDNCNKGKPTPPLSQAQILPFSPRGGPQS